MSEIKNLLPLLDDFTWRAKCRNCTFSKGTRKGEHIAYSKAREHWRTHAHHKVDVLCEVIAFTYEHPEEQGTLDDVPPF